MHRDVSPHNILVGTDGIARVLDFGVAKARGRAQTTAVGQLKGKLAYMAPEQLRGQVTRRTDVFAASVVLWEALTGVRLFQGEDEGDVIDKLMFREIPSPRQYSPLVSAELESVVMRGLERDPERRFATARDMAIALENQAALATPIEVGAWVERVAGVTLALRAERVAAIEAERVGNASGDVEGTSVGEINVRPHRPLARSLTGATSPTVAVPGLARTDDKTVVDDMESVGTGVATVTDLRTPRRTRLVSLISVLGATGLLGLVLMVRAGSHPDAATAKGAGVASAPTGAGADSSGANPAPPPLLMPVVPADSVAQDAPAAPHTSPADATIRRSPPPPARKHADCTPAYTIDARGVRHYKPECI